MWSANDRSKATFLVNLATRHDLLLLAFLTLNDLFPISERPVDIFEVLFQNNFINRILKCLIKEGFIFFLDNDHLGRARRDTYTSLRFHQQ